MPNNIIPNNIILQNIKKSMHYTKERRLIMNFSSNTTPLPPEKHNPTAAVSDGKPAAYNKGLHKLYRRNRTSLHKLDNLY